MIRRAPEQLPELPGVYWWHDDSNVLYVGKAKNLKARVNSYFHDTSAKSRKLRRSATSISWTVTSNETQALLLEAAMIAKLDPPYNIKLKQSHPYPYVCITAETWPAAHITRGKDTIGKHYGPYPDRADANCAYNLAQVLGVRTCTPKRFAAASKQGKACHLLELGRCSGPCVGEVDADTYAERVNVLGEALRGSADDAVKILQSKMLEASACEAYEQAGVWRDRVEAVRKMSSVGATSVKGNAEVYSVASGVVDVVCWQSIKDGHIRDTATWTVPAGSGAEAVRAGVAVSPGTGRVAVLGCEVEGISCYTPRSGAVKDVAEAGVRTAKSHLQAHVAANVAGNDRGASAMEGLANAVGVQNTLRVIGIDVAHHAGKWGCASAVVFEDGVECTKRTWDLPEDITGNDVASIAWAVSKAVNLPQGAYPTSLILVDGGQAQFDAASKASGEVRVASLAKRMEVLHTQDGEVVLPRDAPGLYFAQQIRDRAHQVAGARMKKLAKKSTLVGALHDVPGVGATRRQAVLTHFGSVAKAKEATVAEIANVPGVGTKTAQSIWDTLHPEQRAS